MTEGTAPVVVGTDGSTQARLAVRWAVAEAARRGTRLHVVHAYPWLARATGWETAPSQEALAEAREVAESAAREVSGLVETTTEVVVEDPAVALVRQSAAASLVVVGARGRTGGIGPWVGGQTRGVVENAHCDVVVVRAYVPSDGPVVVGMDPRDHSPHALAYGFADAERRGVGVVVVEALGPYPDGDPTAEDELGRWRERHPGVAAELHQVDSAPATALLEASPGASIVVVGHTRQGFAGLALGSVGRAVVPRLPVVAVAYDPAED